MNDLYQEVTDRIIKALGYGVVPWRKPWCLVDGGAFNRITGRHYSLLNQMCLNYTGEYATFDQWSKLGGRIKKGSKGETIVFWKKLDSGEAENLEEAEEAAESKPKFVLRYYKVFHISHVRNVSPLPREEGKGFEHDRIHQAEEISKDYIARESLGFEEETSSKAYYSPGEDMVHVPALFQFEKVEEYYSTLFHELIHSTGHCRRLNRPKLADASFGSEEYSKEELVAEIGAAAILNGLGLETDDSFSNSIAYIEGWRSKLSKDKYMIIHAASAAEKAARYILDAGQANAS